MIKVYADFNDRTPDDGYWILRHDGADISEKASALGLKAGDHVLLYQDEDDFEVIAVLDFKSIDVEGDFRWVAYPDWNTMKEIQAASPTAPGESGRKVA